MDIFINYKLSSFCIGIGLLIWVKRHPIGFHLCSIGFYLSDFFNWDDGRNFFSVKCNSFFYYHPESFNSYKDDPKYKLFRRAYEEYNLGEPASIDGYGRDTITLIRKELEDERRDK